MRYPVKLLLWFLLQSRCISGLRAAAAFAALVVHCTASLAANYSLPTNISALTGCVQDGTNATKYNCSANIAFSSGDVVTVTSSITLAMASGKTFMANSGVTIQSSGGTLTVSVGTSSTSAITVNGSSSKATTVEANLVATGSGKITTNSTSTVTGTLSAVNGAISVGNVVGNITSTGTGTITLSGTISGGNVQSNSGNISVNSSAVVTGNISSSSGTITTSSSSTVTGDLTVTSAPGVVTLNSKLTGSVFAPTTAGKVSLNNSAYVTCNVTGYESFFSARYGNASSTATEKEKVGGICTVARCDTGNAGSCDGNSPGAGVCGGNTTCAIKVDHYELALPVSNVNCVPSTVTLTACADSSSPCTNPVTTGSGQTAALSTATSGASLAASSVSLGSAGTASTTLSFPNGADGASAAVTLGAVSLTASNALQCCPGGSSCSAAVNNTCSATFNTAGFIVSATSSGAAATVATQTAGTNSGTYYLRAVQSSTASGASPVSACSAALSGTQTVGWAHQCNNPTTCSASNYLGLGKSTAASLTTLQRHDNSASSFTYTDVYLDFDAAGAAPFKINYADVGQVTLYAKKALTASGTVASATLSGSSSTFVVKPAGFTVTTIQQTASPQTPNPAASSATGTKFVKAGESFSATVTATTSSGAATPNFGKETTPEGVLLSPALVLPSGGATGALSNATIPGTGFSSGVANISNLAWSEVGIISLMPSIASSGSESTYLGTSTVSGDRNGAGSANIGRFYPYYFTTVATPACTTGLFTYSGQALGQLRVSAKNASGATTSNFDGPAHGFAKEVQLSEVANSSGIGTLSSGLIGSSAFSAGIADASPVFTFINPATAPTSISLRATDLTDGETSSTVPSSTAVTEASTSIWSGRLRLRNAYGSELLALPVPLSAQYYDGIRFVTNTSDNCTQLTVPTAANGGLNFGSGNLASTETTARFYYGGSYVTTGTVPLVEGVANLSLTAPGKGNDGYLDIEFIQLSDPVYLYYPWTSATATPAKARARFGIYKSPLIHRRESY